MQGTAAYFEFYNKDKNTTSQIVLTQEMPHPADSSILIPATVIHRIVREDNPRSQWSMVPAKSHAADYVDNVESYVAAVVADLGRIFNAFQFADEWELVGGKPEYLGVSPDDAHKIEATMTPDALMRRVEKIRVDANYPTNLWR